MTVELITQKKETILKFTDANAADASKEADILSWLSQHNVKKVIAEIAPGQFSTLLMSEVYYWHQLLTNRGLEIDVSRFPDAERNTLALTLKSINIPPTLQEDNKTFLVKLGEQGYHCFLVVTKSFHFIAQTFISVARLILGKAIYRKKDFWFIFEECSYKAIGITALVSFLVGLILAFVGALQLRAFGAGIYVASMVALGMTRIMAAIMVGIIMAGRTGSSFAATLGTMQVNEEIDALKTLGIKITDYLVAPRLFCLTITIPFLTLLADLLGIFGGLVVGVCFLNISAVAYFDFSIKALSLTNILIGLLHSLIYGIIISLCGCYEGLTAGRDADAVGKATTNSVVTALVWMIVATGLLTIILEAAGL